MAASKAIDESFKPSQGNTVDLFRVPFIKSVFSSQLYPLAFQIISLIVFALVILYGFLGPPLGENNFAVVVTWKLWWLLLPLSFVLFGRLWCGVCPVGAINAAAGRMPVPGRRWPGRFLKKRGVWIMGSLFLLLFWLGITRHICCWPKATAIILLFFVGGAVLAGLAYHGRVWCRHLCPLGVFSGLYSMTAVIALRAKRGVCRDKCRIDRRLVLREEMKGCPLFELPMAIDTNRNCNLCGNCVKFCQREAMSLTLRRPGGELWALRRPLIGEALFALTLVAIAFVEAIQTTELYPRYMKWALERDILASYDAVFLLSFLAVVTVVVGFYLLASYLARRAGNAGRKLNMAYFGYSFVPLALAGYLGVAIFRLANQGVRAVQVAVNQLSLGLAPFELPPPVRGAYYTVNFPVKALQFALLLMGTLGALYVIWRIAKRRRQERAMAIALPHLGLVLALSAVLWFIFLLPAGIILH